MSTSPHAYDPSPPVSKQVSRPAFLPALDLSLACSRSAGLDQMTLLVRLARTWRVSKGDTLLNDRQPQRPSTLSALPEQRARLCRARIPSQHPINPEAGSLGAQRAKEVGDALARKRWCSVTDPDQGSGLLLTAEAGRDHGFVVGESGRAVQAQRSRGTNSRYGPGVGAAGARTRWPS
jgi:hypothetical protein